MKTKTKPTKARWRLHSRWLVRKDVQEVLAIEAMSFDFPWDEEALHLALRCRNVIGLVFEDDRHSILGYVIYSLEKYRVDILNLAVAPDVLREGIGRQMVDKMREKLDHGDRRWLKVDVCESNTAAQCFFRACGFRAVRVIPSPYSDYCDQDAYRMTLGRNS